MTTTTDANEVKVPDIGDFSGVPVIEIHRLGSKPQAATMSVPSAPMSGLKRPSRVGPRLDVTCAMFLGVSMLPTEMIRSAHASPMPADGACGWATIVGSAR